MNINPVKWYMKQKGYDDVVVSSSIRFARNLAEYDFRDKISNDDAIRLVEQVRELTPELAGRECTEYFSCNVNKLPENERNTLVEMFAISRELADKKQATGLIISEDESISIMINENEHIRISSIVAGNNLRGAFAAADRIDDYFDSRLRYAYSDRYGYLTTGVSDVGTGMKATCVLSLPALAISGKLNAIRDEVGKCGAVFKDMYADDGKNLGFIYAVSNQKTLGCSEQEIIENLDQVVSQLVGFERKRRSAWIANDRDEVEDKVFRSYGVLKHTRLITLKDAMTLLAQLKLGSDAGLIRLSGDGSDLFRIMIQIQPANIAKLYKCGTDPKEIDRARASYLNEKIPSLSNFGN